MALLRSLGKIGLGFVRGCGKKMPNIHLPAPLIIIIVYPVLIDKVCGKLHHFSATSCFRQGCGETHVLNILKYLVKIRSRVAVGILIGFNSLASSLFIALLRVHFRKIRNIFFLENSYFSQKKSLSTQ